MNDRLIYVTVFDSENDSIQAIFQAYALNNVDNHYKYQMMKINIIQSIEKHLNTIHNI